MLEHSPVSIEESDLRALQMLTYGDRIRDSRKMAYSGTGTANSPFRSRGLDFQEIRAYQPGDDVRQIDWRTTAKHGKPFTKLYTDEKERPVYFVCDLRTRMKFASHGDFKSVVAARMTMFLAWLVAHKKDRIGSVILLPDQVKSTDLRGTGGVEALIAHLTAGGTPMPEETDSVSLEQALLFLAREAKIGAMIFICSDLSDLTPTAMHILERISSRRSIVLFHIYDELERRLPPGFWPVTDGQRITTVDMANRSYRRAFERSFQEQATHIKKTAERYGWGYYPIQTTDDYLGELSGLMRKGAL